MDYRACREGPAGAIPLLTKGVESDLSQVFSEPPKSSVPSRTLPECSEMNILGMYTDLMICIRGYVLSKSFW